MSIQKQAQAWQQAKALGERCGRRPFGEALADRQLEKQVEALRALALMPSAIPQDLKHKMDILAEEAGLSEVGEEDEAPAEMELLASVFQDMRRFLDLLDILPGGEHWPDQIPANTNQKPQAA